jgi:threonine/homoserine/homoserine lactone efflux protein
MMVQAIGDILTPALGVALSPFPIVAVILMLASGQGRIKGPAFAIGWALGLVIVVGLLLVVAARVGIEQSDDGPSTTASVVRLVLGLGLLLLAARNVRSRPGPGETPPLPGWMASIERTTPLTAFMYGALFSGVNPKNLMFNLIAGTAISSSGASTGGEVGAWIVYILIASGTVIAPVVWYLVSPASASARLEQPRLWLIRNSSVMVAVMLLFIGVSQIGEAISALGS